MSVNKNKQHFYKASVKNNLIILVTAIVEV